MAYQAYHLGRVTTERLQGPEFAAQVRLQLLGEDQQIAWRCEALRMGKTKGGDRDTHDVYVA